MPENNPITDAELAEVKRLIAVAKLGPMVSVHITTPRYEHCANLCTRLEGHKSDYPVAMMQAEWADVIAATFNAFGPVLARLEAAERERDERTTMAARAQEALRYVMNGLPTTDAVWAAYGNADSARAWLAARDAQQRHEGAAEWIEGFCVDLERQPQGPLFGGVLEMLRAEAKRLREGGK